VVKKKKKKRVEEGAGGPERGCRAFRWSLRSGRGAKSLKKAEGKGFREKEVMK